MNLPHFDFHAPLTLAECVELLESCGSDADIVAGGTDLFVRMKQGLAQPSHVVSLSKIDELNGVSYDTEHGLMIGAGVRLQTLLDNPSVVERYSAIREAALRVATRQVRYMATIGGNLLQSTRCLYYNRSPVWRKAVPACIKRDGDVCHVVSGSKRCFAVYQGDMAPLLIALGATLTFVSCDGMEERPLETIFTGDGKAPFRINNKGILARITIPDRRAAHVVRYKKYRLRDGVDFPLAGVAVALFMDDDRVTDLRICLTGVWSSPVLVSAAREVAAGRKLDGTIVREIADRAYEAAHPLPNVIGSPELRRSMVRHMVEEILSAEIRHYVRA
jgi:4-hydroxybenzoyl-CoA reductase subunit beta